MPFRILSAVACGRDSGRVDVGPRVSKRGGWGRGGGGGRYWTPRDERPVLAPAGGAAGTGPHRIREAEEAAVSPAALPHRPAVTLHQQPPGTLRPQLGVKWTSWCGQPKSWALYSGSLSGMVTDPSTGMPPRGCLCRPDSYYTNPMELPRSAGDGETSESELVEEEG